MTKHLFPVFYKKDITNTLWFGGSLSGRNLERFISSEWVSKVVSCGVEKILIPNQIFFGIHNFNFISLSLLSVLATLHFPPGSAFLRVSFPSQDFEMKQVIVPLSGFEYEFRVMKRKKDVVRLKFILSGIEKEGRGRVVFPPLFCSLSLAG